MNLQVILILHAEFQLF